MARQDQVDREDFAISVEWPDRPTSGGERDLDASVGRLTIVAGGEQITAFRNDKGDTGDSLTVPLYGVAEWIARNWWPLLFEPRKSDDAEADFGYRSRHWLGFARDGMALPDLWFFPAGEKIELVCRETYLRFARLTFPTKVDASPSVDAVRNQLFGFVEGTLSRMAEVGVADTDAHEIWEAVRRTGPEEEHYCRLIGALGLSPYEPHDLVDEILDSLEATVSDSVLYDLCQASSGEGLERTSQTTSDLVKALPESPTMNLLPLAEAGLPADFAPQAFRWGLDAADKARTQLGISAYDPSGGEAFFNKLDVGSEFPAFAESGSDAGQVTAGVSRHDEIANVALIEGDEPQRRFAAARSAFIGWVAAPGSSRLVTAAKTREQQASRSFAAEILAPIGYIKRKAQAGIPISSYGLERIANELHVSPAVVRYQVQNNNLEYVNY